MDMTEEERIQELVSMLDSFVENGGGHMNVLVEESADLEPKDSESTDSESMNNVSIQVETYRSTDCCKGNMACAVPTLHKGIDDN